MKRKIQGKEGENKEKDTQQTITLLSDLVLDVEVDEEEPFISQLKTFIDHISSSEHELEVELAKREEKRLEQEIIEKLLQKIALIKV